MLGRVLGEVIGEQAGQDVLDLVESTRVEAFKIRRSEVDREELAERLGGPRRPVGQPRHPRVQPLLAAGQPGRGHPPRAAPPVPPARGLAAAEGQPRRGVPGDRRGRPRRRRRRPGAGRRAGLPGRHRPPDRGAPQDDLRRCSGRSPSCSASATAPRPARSTTREWSAQLWRSVLTLWQTALLRLSRLRLQDEIDEALRYYELSLFEVVPAINAELRRALDERWPDAGLLPPADAAARLVDRRRPRRQPVRHRRRAAPGHHAGRPRPRSATTSHELERAAHASCRCPTGWSRRRRSSTPWPTRRGDDSPFRADEPYRRALGGISARLAATAHGASSAAMPGPAPDVAPAAVRLARRAARRPRRRRRLAAQPRRRRAGRRPAAAAARGGRGVRLPPVRAGPAAERRRPRGGRRRAAGLGRRVRRLRGPRRGGAGRAAGRAS